MALSDLLRTLEQEAAARTEEVRSRARRDAERVRAEADAEREDRRSSALNAAEAELRMGAAREVEGARRAAAARRLEARGTALARIRARVERRLDARADDIGLLPLVRRDLRRALEYAGEGDAVLTASPGLAGPLLQEVRGVQGLRVEAASHGGGLSLRAADGAWAVDATFRSRLDRAWPHLAIGLVRRLEAET
jgi:vacuolar-type H+-ATPase subunit E/Vma4